jgi:hypothetical protein
VDGMWVFGAIERRDDKTDPIKVRLFAVADRTKETLMHIIKSLNCKITKRLRNLRTKMITKRRTKIILKIDK